MCFALKNNQKRIQFIRSFYYKNTHKVSFTFENMTISYTIPKEISLKPLIKASALLQLITNQRSFFLRAKKSSVTSKIRKGAPVGVIISLRGKMLNEFFLFLIWEIFPNIKNHSPILSKRKYRTLTDRSCFSFTVADCLVFPQIKKFYTSFKTCLGLQCVISLKKKLTQVEVILNTRYSSLPF
jgi:large subunit ribosomal protein L5